MWVQESCMQLFFTSEPKDVLRCMCVNIYVYMCICKNSPHRTSLLMVSQTMSIFPNEKTQGQLGDNFEGKTNLSSGKGKSPEYTTRVSVKNKAHENPRDEMAG